MILLSFNLVIVPVVNADWWERGERPILPRETIIPTIIVETTQPEPTLTPDPSQQNGDPCAPGKSYKGDYCGWSPRIGGTDSGDPSDPGDPPVVALSNTAKDDIRLSDIMLLSGILCLLLYVKSKLAPAKEIIYSKKK